MAKTTYKYETMEEASLLAGNHKVNEIIESLTYGVLKKMEEFLKFHSCNLTIDEFDVRDSLFTNIEITSNGMLKQSILLQNHVSELIWLQNNCKEFAENKDKFAEREALFKKLQTWRNIVRDGLLTKVQQAIKKIPRSERISDFALKKRLNEEIKKAAMSDLRSVR